MDSMPTRKCQECGEEVSHNRWRKGKRLCPACGIARAVMWNAGISRLRRVVFDNKGIVIATPIDYIDGTVVEDGTSSSEE